MIPTCACSNPTSSFAITIEACGFMDQLGFNVVADARFAADGRWVAVAPPNGSAILALVAPKPGSEDYALVGRATQISFITEDIHATFEQWHKRGVHFDRRPQTTSWGGMSANFQDVDGNSFELLASDDMSREIEAQRRASAEKLESERRAVQELEIAKQVPARLFPQMLPPLKTLDYAGICIQARQVGGDYYDLLSLGEDRLGLVFSDVSGKGIAGTLLMANLQANLRSQCAIALDHPERLLRSVNHVFLRKFRRQRLRDHLLRRIRRQGGAPALRELWTSVRPSAAERQHPGAARFNLYASGTL
jgi:predicted enzyme related to lactoylglutathione lyase